jgi:hypothetical protein
VLSNPEISGYILQVVFNRELFIFFLNENWAINPKLCLQGFVSNSRAKHCCKLRVLEECPLLGGGGEQRIRFK